MAQSELTDATVTTERSSGGLASLLYDRKARGLFFQIALIVSVIGFFVWIIRNTAVNLAAQDKETGFDFLSSEFGTQISSTLGTWVMGFDRSSTYLDVFLIGVINTLAVAVVGIVAATLLGFLLGVFRLSSNIVLKGFATAYVELIRNLPLLLQMLFCYALMLAFLPAKRGEPWDLGFGWRIDLTGLWGWAPLPQAGFEIVSLAFIACVAGWIVYSRIANGIQAKTGKRPPVFWVGLGVTLIAPTILFYALGGPLEWEEPIRGRFGFREGAGISIKVEMIAVVVALTLYTASFIAEIVRAGILAVNKGQTEAAYALGVRPQPTLNLIIIPQAMRVIIPPLTSQFLNLTKNSSLAVAVAYPEVVSVFAGTALNQSGREIEIILMTMMVYLFFSIIISVFMNWYNKRIALIER